MKRALMAITLACFLSGTALAGEMPGVNHGSVTDDVPTVGSTTGTTAPGEMPGVGPTSDETDSSVIVTVLFTIISLIGR